MHSPQIPQFPKLISERCPFLQITGEDGSGTRRLAFSFMEQKKKALWISSDWKIYAPALWSLAEENKVFLMGLENPDRSSYRKIFYELHDSQVFDIWILDHLQLKEADGFFLQKLLKYSSTQVIVLDRFPHSFCQKRLRVFLSHHHFRIQWTKGGPLQPEYIPAINLMESKEDLCTLSV